MNAPSIDVAAPPPFDPKIHEQYGPRLDPLISLAGEAKPDSGPPSQELLKRLADGVKSPRYCVNRELARCMGAILTQSPRPQPDALPRTVASWGGRKQTFPYPSEP